MELSISAELHLVPVSKVSAEDLVAFRKQANKESGHVNRITLQEAEQWVENGENFMLLVRGDALVGQLVLDPHEPPDMYIDLISVLNSEKGKGGADMLFAFAERQAHKLKCKTLSLAVSRKNERAQAFYKRHGLTYTRKLGVDALLYSKPIGE